MQAELEATARAWRLVLPQTAQSGRTGDRLGHGAGSSLEFMEFRPYVPGDDLRHVDWRAYARTDQLHIRRFRQEVAPSLDIVLDGSASMRVTDAKARAAHALASAARLWSQQAGGQARVLEAGGGLIERGVSPRFEGPDADDLSPLLPLRPRTLRMVIGDFLRPEDPLPLLRRLAAGASYLYVLQLLDPWEAEPTAEGATTLLDCEDGDRLELVLDATAIKRYRQRLERLTERVRAATRQMGGCFARVLADEPAAMFAGPLLAQGVLEPA